MTEQRKLTKKIAPVIIAVAAAALVGACGDDDSSDSDATSTTPMTAATTTMGATTSGSATATTSAGMTSVEPGTPAATLSSTPWETTSAEDASGTEVALDNDNVENFVGYAYFEPDGTFTMYDLEDSPKMQGEWSVSPDGKTRTLIAMNDAGEEQYRRDVDIVTLTDQEFTYRVYPDPADKTVYYDIVHTPTTHQKPAN
ncbi:DUF4822 domain-containing protein [Nocardia sp. NPDC059177]|uniref:DUF4822 domain-containing protein n=1 Tax=Nocardia sp. NPDC059177 TaxID=3346759 RepID=UPI0036A3C772